MQVDLWRLVLCVRCSGHASSSGQSAIEWLADKVLGPLFAGIIIAGFGGWWLARVNEHYRGKREHLTKAVDALMDQVSDLVSLASIYWTQKHAPQDPAAEAEIEFRLEQVGSLMRICAAELWGNENSEGPALVGKLAAAIVTEKYATPNRPADLTRPRQIGQAAGEITDAVLGLRKKFFEARPRLSNLVRQSNAG